jgi:peptidoglycan hydrolase-like protein with peptidoglycan-binding domain
MARVYLRHHPQPLRVLYDVDAAVGRGGPNRRDDVLLIQLLLRVATEDSPDSPGYRPPGEDLIAIDGSYGRQTQAYIDFFQQEAKRRNPKQLPLTDGKIDPLHTPFRHDNNDQWHDITALNRLYQKRRGAVHENIGNDPLFPAELGRSFY